MGWERSHMEWNKDKFTVTDRREELDIDFIHGFLSNISYWSKGIPKDIVVKSLDNSLCFGLFEGDRQIGFGRAVTDKATFAYLADVFVLEGDRGQGLGKWLVDCMLVHPDIAGLRRWMLATADAHELYRKYGFTSLENPERLMERVDSDLYLRGL